MTARDTSSVGAPCWVDSWQPDPKAAKDFYGQLFGWTFDDPLPMSPGFDGDYYGARLRGELVAGIGQAPPLSPPGWLTHIRVDDVGESLARAERAGGKRLGPGNVAVCGALPTCRRPVRPAAGGSEHGVELADEPNCWAMSSLHSQAFYGPCLAGSSKRCLSCFSLWLRSAGSSPS